MKPNKPLYEIDDKYLYLLDAFEFAETDEEIAELESQLKAIDDEHEHKAEAICALVKNLGLLEKQAEAQRKVLAEAATEYAKKRDARKNKKDRIAEYLRLEMVRLGFDKRKYGNFSTWQQDYDSLDVDEVVPPEYCTLVPDNGVIREELEAGGELEFARIITTTKLQIR